MTRSRMRTLLLLISGAFLIAFGGWLLRELSLSISAGNYDFLIADGIILWGAALCAAAVFSERVKKP